MIPRHGAIEELHQMRRWALLGEQLEKDLECARPAQPPESFPDAVPFAELGRDGPPTEAIHREKDKCFQEPAIIVPRLAPPGSGCPENFQHQFPVLLRQFRQHVWPPLPVTQ
jgi:hypothetical protein